MLNFSNIKLIYQYLVCLFLLGQVLDISAQSNQYLHFDKIDDFVEIADASQYIANADGVTISGWFYCDALAYGQGMMGFRNGGTGDGEMYMIQLGDGILECRYITSGNTAEVVAPATTAEAEVWQHYAWVYGNNAVTLYLDGVAVGSTPTSNGPITSTNTPFSIGSLITPWNFYFGGRIDEVSVWSKALSATEIIDMMANELNGNEANLELYYKFNQGVPGGDNTTISSLICEVGNGERDGNLTNFTLTGETSNFNGELDNTFQAINFPSLSDKLISDDPFSISADATSGLPVTYSIVSGPASIADNVITLDGVVGEVVVRASQVGDGTYEPAEDIDNSFQVLDPNTFVPTTETRSPLVDKEVWVPELGPIQLAAITSIGSPELFSVDNVVFEIDGTNVDAKDWNNNHYTGWWTPPAYGTYTMNIIASNNYGASSTEVVNFTVVDEMSNITSNAATEVWLDVNVGTQTVEAELPCYMGAFDMIMTNLSITCPTGGCDPWDRVSSVEVKGHDGVWYEIIRYLTPYGIACNHSVDLTDFMSLLQGKVAFRFNLGTAGNGFLYTLDFDYNGGIPTHKYSTVGKLWNDTYDFGNPGDLQPCEIKNVYYSEYAVASKIKLLSTGHGWGPTNTGNAAEFHHDIHHVWVDGEETFAQDNWLNCDPNPDGCDDQFGTWYYDRAGWCPGAIAPWFDFDMTPYININGTELKYIFNEDYQDFCHPNNPDCVTGVTCENCNEGFNPHLIVASYLISLGNQPLDGTGVVAIHDLANGLDFKIYPNPSSGIFNVEFDHLDEVQEINITNSLGQIVRTIRNQSRTNVAILHLDDLAKGVYFVELKTTEASGMKKIIIE